MNTNRFDRDNYKSKISILKTDEDKDKCLRFLTTDDRHNIVCHSFYTKDHLNAIIQSSGYFLFYHRKDNIHDIVAFALVKIKKHMLDVLLLCAIPNKEHYGHMMGHFVYIFAFNKHCNRIYTSPRTPELRNTFIKYGFEHFRGVHNLDEVLVKSVNLDRYNKTYRTRKLHRFRQIVPTRRVRYSIMNNLYSLNSDNVE
jgi:hypothetical protein